MGRVASGLLKLCGRDPETEDDEDVWLAAMMTADAMHDVRELKSAPGDIVVGFAKVMAKIFSGKR